jgi:magnesium and cobalt transporter
MISISSFASFPSKSWFNRVKQTLSSQPQDKKQLIRFLQDAKRRNLLNTETLSMIEGALNVSEKQVRDVMIPRSQMVVLELYDPPEQLVKTIADSGHSRFPVIGENRDDVQGIFLAKDLLEYYAKNNDSQFNMRDVMRPAIFIPESKRLNVLLREFQTSRNHIAIVVDEYSGVAGLVTIEDVIEQIVGEIDDEHDIDDQIFIRNYRNGLYTVFGQTPIEEFNEFFQAQLSEEEFDTIGGLIIQAFGRLPKRGEQIDFEGFHVEVARADNRRIQWLRVNPKKKAKDDQNKNSAEAP